MGVRVSCCLTLGGILAGDGVEPLATWAFNRDGAEQVTAFSE
jgi:hypothetical protein